MDIFEAVKAGDCEKILEHISQVNAANDKLETPLMVSIQNMAVDAIQVLIRNGADLNAIDKAGKTPLYWAVVGKQIEIVSLILDAGADVNASNKDADCALLRAVTGNQVPIVQLLLNRGADVDQTSPGNLVPIVEAASKGFDHLVMLLLRHGANPNISTIKHSNSTLLRASQKCSHGTVKALLDTGADPWHAAKNGNSPLSMASDELMKRLILEYRKVDGPSWLVRELSKRGLQWEAICDVQDKLAKEGCTTREAFINTPVSLLTHAYLEKIGITALWVRLALLELRLQGTWLGARLAARGESYTSLRAAEEVVLETLGCHTEEAFAALDTYSIKYSVGSNALKQRLLEVHRNVCAEQGLKRVPAPGNTSTADVPTAKKSRLTRTQDNAKEQVGPHLQTHLQAPERGRSQEDSVRSGGEVKVEEEEGSWETVSNGSVKAN